MEKTKIKKIFKAIKINAIILFKGFVTSACGTMAFGLVVLAIFGFMSVSGKSGWVAVFEFVVSCTTLILALSNMYLIGAYWKVQKKS